jgi:hypothetical protein
MPQGYDPARFASNAADLMPSEHQKADAMSQANEDGVLAGTQASSDIGGASIPDAADRRVRGYFRSANSARHS